MADERNEDDRIAPVALPAGQFDVLELRDALEKAVSVKNRDTHPERINAAIVNTIKNPELLARDTRPDIPVGAELVEQPVTYTNDPDEEPVVREHYAFKAADAKSGEDAAKMRYDPRTEEPTKEPAAVIPTDEELEPTLANQAAERIADESDTTSAASGSRGRNR